MMTPFSIPEAVLDRRIAGSQALSDAPTLRVALDDGPTVVVFVRHLG